MPPKAETSSTQEGEQGEFKVEHPQDKVPHVTGDDGAGDIFHGGDDSKVIGEPLTKAESLGHETEAHYKHRVHMEGRSDVEILKDEGADLPHHTHAGKVDLPGAAD